MTNQYDYDDDDDFDAEESTGPASLRKALKKAEREAKALKDELSTLKSAARQRSVKDVLEAKGVNPKIAAFIPADVDAPEKIATWLDEYSDVFGFAMQQSDAPINTEDAVNARRIDSAVSNANTPSRDEDLASLLASAQTKDELDQLIFGTKLGR